MRLTQIGFCAGLILARASAQSTCINFPAGLIPFSSISYVTAADSAGDHLVVGALAGGVGSLSALPLPASTNQTFCGQVQLAPQQFYPNVYVPTGAEQSGDFAAFAGLLVDPSTNLPFPNGVIPSGKLGAVYAFRIGAAQPPQTTAWSPTGSMAYARYGQPAVLLPSGKVFVAGEGSASSNELYDPATGIFAVLSALNTYNVNVSTTATLLQDGRVLIAGGNAEPSAAEIYDPVAGRVSALPAMEQPHADTPTATLLNDGRVLIVGGFPSGTLTPSGAELFNPAAGTFSSAGAISQTRSRHTATLLPDGRVLVAGGMSGVIALNSAEIFDPSTRNFTPTGSMYSARTLGYAVLLPNGKVLVAGGDAGDLPASAELFDPTKGTFVLTGAPVSGVREYAGATLLSSGQVLVSGGTTASSSELYVPATGSFTPAGKMTAPREGHTSTLLPDGRVLVTGGDGGGFTFLASAELYTPVLQGLVTSQTGVTFRAAPNGASATQTIQVLSPTTSIPWTLSVKTYSGGSWLAATPSGATDAPTSAPTPVSITVNPSGLAAQNFYGAVTLTPTDGVHPPISITVVLSIVPAGTAAPAQVSPTGLVFVATSGVTAKPQAFTISNITSTPLTFTATGTSAAGWFTFAPKSGSITAALPATITVTPASASLSPGVYPGTIALAFSDSTTQTVTLLLVVSSSTPTSLAMPSATSAHLRDFATAACTPTKLLPVLTSVGTGFSAPAGWPVAVIAQIVDDCGDLINTGSAVASFTNSDPPVSLIAIGGGTWSATWVPGPSYAGSSIRVDAQTPDPALVGSVQVNVAVASNPTVPVVTAGGIVSNADFASAPALGLLVSIFGSGLADGSLGDTGAPLPPQLGSTSVVLSGTQLPLLYVSNTQVNVAIPFNIQTNTSQQLVVLRGNAVSVPVSLAVFASEPSILSASGSGSGQGLIFNALTGVRADTNAPAGAGDYLVMYALGLGAVTPNLAIGDGTPSAPYEYAVAPVTVTIGGIPATVLFAGLTPGYVGLYQVNVEMPTGVAPGSQVPVTVSVAGKSGAGNITIAVH